MILLITLASTALFGFALHLSGLTHTPFVLLASAAYGGYVYRMLSR